MTFFKKIFRIPLLPTSFIENDYLQKYLNYRNTNYTVVKYDMEYVHGEIVKKGSLISDINLCNQFVPHYTSETHGKLILTRNLGLKQNGLIYFGHQDYQIVCGISNLLSNQAIRNLTLGWIIINN
jgi:hypothetical protein